MLVPFALDRKLGGGSVARGPMRRLTEQRFREMGVDAVNEALVAFYTLTDEDKSELYQLMPKHERKRFLAAHEQMNISVPKAGGEAKIYAGPSLDLRKTLLYPFVRETFAEDILSSFGTISPQ